MLKYLDRYVSRKFLVNLLIALITWLIIFLVVDIIENLSRFLDKNATLGQVFRYYVYFIPYIISLTLPVAMLLSALFTMSTFAQYNEIVAQLSSGISLYRLLAPVLILAVLISILAAFFNEFIVPEANQRRFEIERYEVYRKTRPSKKSRSNIYRQDTADRKISIKYFNGKSNTARNASIKTLNESILIERIDAVKMIWQDSVWRLEEGIVRKFTDSGEIIYSFQDSILTDIRIKPENLIELQKKPEEMSFSELNIFIEELQSLGADARKWIVERHLKISMPFANFIVVLLGAPLASRKRRGGMGLNFGVSLLVSFVYFIIVRTGQVLGHQGSLEPVLAAWLGNLIFFTLGLYTLISVKK